MAEPSAPVDTTPASATGTPAAPAATPPEPAAPATTPSPTPNGSEPDNNPGSGEPAMVPSDRLREETEKRRKSEEENARLKQELEASKTSPTPPDTDDLDPEVVDLVSKSAKKLGFVTQEELATERNKIQVQQDIRELKANPPNAGIPFDDREVSEYAKDHSLPITSREAWVAAYRQLNYDKIVEAERQRAIDGFKNAGRSGAELPASPGAQPPSEPELDKSLSPKERTRERIRRAAQRLA